MLCTCNCVRCFIFLYSRNSMIKQYILLLNAIRGRNSPLSGQLEEGGQKKLVERNFTSLILLGRCRSGGAGTALGLSRAAAALRGRNGVAARFETGRRGGGVIWANINRGGRSTGTASVKFFPQLELVMHFSPNFPTGLQNVQKAML